MASTNTLQRVAELWSIDLAQKSPIEIPDVTRNDLAWLFSELRFNRGVEVGTETGVYAKELLDNNNDLTLYCVDPYLAYKDYREHTSQSKLDDLYTQATTLLQGRNAVFLRQPSIDAARTFKDNSLDFVYLDGNHSLPYVVADLHAWVPKVRRGGIISGHDMIRRNNRLRYQCHVVEAVYAWTECYMINPWFVVGSKAETPGQKRDIIRSFFWVKE